MKNFKKKDNTAQQRTRAVFLLANSFLGPLGPIIKEGFRQKTKSVRRKRIIPRNLAIAHLIKYAVRGQFPSYRIDPSAVLLSDGPIEPVENVTVEIVDGALRAVLGIQPVSEWNHDDLLRLVGYQIDDATAIRSMVPARRSDHHVALRVPDHLKGKKLLLYLLVCDRKEDCYARSTYLGEYTVSSQ